MGCVVNGAPRRQRGPFAQEEIGTGGAGFRFMYASFLQEAGEKIGATELGEASARLTAIGDDFEERQKKLDAMQEQSELVLGELAAQSELNGRIWASMQAFQALATSMQALSEKELYDWR